MFGSKGYFNWQEPSMDRICERAGWLQHRPRFYTLRRFLLPAPCLLPVPSNPRSAFWMFLKR